jgi:hypothetical protein
MFVTNDNSPRLVFKEPRRVLRPLRRCKQLSPGKASLGDGPWPFGLQKQSELNQEAVEAVRSAAQEFAAVEAPLREYSDVPRAHTTSTAPI